MFIQIGRVICLFRVHGIYTVASTILYCQNSNLLAHVPVSGAIGSRSASPVPQNTQTQCLHLLHKCEHSQIPARCGLASVMMASSFPTLGCGQRLEYRGEVTWICICVDQRQGEPISLLCVGAASGDYIRRGGTVKVSIPQTILLLLILNHYSPKIGRSSRFNRYLK